jgi:hypothetical protein
MSQLKELLLAHIGYSAWATRRVLGACSALTVEQLDEETGASHFSILQTLRHIHDGERVWLRRLIEVHDTVCLVGLLRSSRLSLWFKPGLGFGTVIMDGSKLLLMTI